MRKLKNKKKDNKVELIEEQTSYSVKNMIIVLVIILVMFIGFYFITVAVVNNQSSDGEEVVTQENYQTEKILVSQMLSRKESEYYVYAYNQNSKFYQLFDEKIKTYEKKEDALPIYLIDINDGMNKEFIGKETIIDNNLNNMKISDSTLLKIKDKQIESSYITNDDIMKKLKEISE